MRKQIEEGVTDPLREWIRNLEASLDDLESAFGEDFEGSTEDRNQWFEEVDGAANDLLATLKTIRESDAG